MNPPDRSALNHLRSTPTDPRRLFLTYLHCLYEAKHDEILCKFSCQSDSFTHLQVYFEYYHLSSHDLNVVWYFILDIARKCYPKSVLFNFQLCRLNDHSIESAVTTLFKREKYSSFLKFKWMF